MKDAVCKHCHKISTKTCIQFSSPSLHHKMKRSISPLTMVREPHVEPFISSSLPPRRKRIKPEKEVLHDHSTDEDDVAALLLSLAAKHSSLETKQKRELKSRLSAGDDTKKPPTGDEKDHPHRVVSDDEDDESVSSCAAQRRSRTIQPTTSRATNLLSTRTTGSATGGSDWKAFSRPLCPPPRLPMVPAGFVFPSRNTVAFLKN